MDATLTREQEQIAEAFGEFLDSRGGVDLARQVMDGDEAAAEGVIDDLWADLADLGYPSLTVPTDYGGFGEGAVHSAVVHEEAGSVAMPGPFPETVAFVTPLLDDLATPSQKETHFAAVDDGATYTVALYDEKEPLPESIQLRAESEGDGYVLNGTKTLVPYGGLADRILVAARTRDESGFDGLSLFLVEADDVTVRQLASLDRVRPLSELSFDDVGLAEEALVGPLHGGGDALRAALDRYSIARNAMLVGAAERTVEGSVAHATEREQYGNPVGMYQAVKHRIVDMWVATQSARSLVYYAAWACDEGAPDAARAVSAATSYVADELVEVFEDDIKNHGGTGFTWDHDAHVFLKQARAWQRYLGSADSHRERIAREGFETVDY